MLIVSGLFAFYGVLMAVLLLTDERRRSIPWRISRARLTEAQEHEDTASERVARTERGPFRRLPLAQGSGYVLARTTSYEARDKNTNELLEIDRRLRAHNRRPSPRLASVRFTQD